MAGGVLSGPCSLCGVKSSCAWRPLPECTGDKARQPACNACFISVWKRNRDDPGSVAAILAARTALQTAPRTKRRRRGVKLLRCRPSARTPAGKKRARSGSPQRQQSGEDCDEESSGGNSADLTDGKEGQEEEEEQQQQQAEQRQQQEQPSPPPPPQQQLIGAAPPPQQPLLSMAPLASQQQQQQPTVAEPPQTQQHQRGQPRPSTAPLAASTQHYMFSPLHAMPLPPPPPLPHAQPPQQQLAPPAVIQQQLHAAPLPLHPPLPQLLPHVLLPKQPQLLPLPQQLSTVVAAPPPLWAAQLSEPPGLSRVFHSLEPGLRTAPKPPVMQQVLVDMNGSSQEAASRAWLAACDLPGAQAELLALLPAMWVQDADGPVQLAGVLLMRVLLPPPGLSHEALLMSGQQLQPELRLVVYCFQTGRLLHCRERLGQEECLLNLHPRIDMPAWDSREGWQLLFPEMGARKQQVTLFANLVLRFGRPLRPDQISSGPKAGVAPAAAAAQLPPPQPPPTSVPASASQPPPAAASAAAAWHPAGGGHWSDRLLDAFSDELTLVEAAGAAGIPLTDDDVRYLGSCLGPSP